MTKEKKQELRKLLHEAKKRLKIRDEYGVPLCLPEDLYREYLQESWQYYGLDCFSPYWIRLSLDIACASTKSRLLDFIREELAQFLGVGGDTITATTCLIESTSTDRPSVCRFDSQHIHLDLILKRLLDIALVRGIGEAVSVFDRCSRPEGAHMFFQDVALVEGLIIKKDLEVFKGVRLVPLRSSEISRKVGRKLPRFPYYAFLRETSNFGGKTLLVIDRPGFSIFHERGTAGESPLQDLPFQIGEQNVIFRTRDEIDSFQERFTQALSLILNHHIQISYRCFGLGEERTFNLRDGSVAWPRHTNRFRVPTEASEAAIEKANCLYERLVDLDSGGRNKLQIAIDRWIKSKAAGREVDKIIDLGIALEALYVSEPHPEKKGKDWQIRNHASAYLEADAKPQEELKNEFQEIYRWRSAAVHKGRLPRKKITKTKKIPYTQEEKAKFVRRAQKLCRKSILTITQEDKIPDWGALRQRAN